jgi:DNA polymerase-3 subunit epsilon
MEELFRYKYPFNPLTVNIVDPFNILFKYEPRTLEFIYKKMCGKEIENAHSAEADIMATIEVFNKQVEQYELPQSINEISKIVRTDKTGASMLDFNGLFLIKDNQYYYNIGKHKEKKVCDHMDYLEWVIKDSTFSSNTKFTAFKIKQELTEVLK